MTGDEMGDRLTYAQAVLGIMAARIGGSGIIEGPATDADLTRMCEAAKEALSTIYMQLGGIAAASDLPAPPLYYPAGGSVIVREKRWSHD